MGKNCRAVGKHCGTQKIKSTKYTRLPPWSPCIDVYGLFSTLTLTLTYDDELLISGEALEEDDDYDDEDEEGEEEEDEDEDADPDFDPSKVKPGQNPQECKQQ